MTFTFTVRENSKGRLNVYVQYIHNEKAFRKSTGVSIKPTNWNEETKQLYKVSASDRRLIDNKMDQLKKHVARLEDAGKSISVQNVKATFKTYLESISKEPEKELANDFLSVFKLFINEHQNVRESSTLKGYGTLYNSLNEFNRDVRKITFESMNKDFERDFRNYLLDEKELIDNTIGGRFKTLKTFLRWALKNGYPVNLEFMDFKAEKIEPTKIFLTPEELNMVENYKPEIKELEISKDLFVLQCNTGLAIADLLRLDKSHIDGNRIVMIRYKTQKKIIVPIANITKEILEKYDYRLPKVIVQVYNRHIKKIVKAAGVESGIEQLKIRNSKKYFKSVKKHEVISSHAAVRTFITKASSKGMSVAQISAMTSKTPKVILSSYLGADIGAAEDTMLNDW